MSRVDDHVDPFAEYRTAFAEDWQRSPTAWIMFILPLILPENMAIPALLLLPRQTLFPWYLTRLAAVN